MQKFIKNNIEGDYVSDFYPEGGVPPFPSGALLKSINTRYAGRDGRFAGGRTTVLGNELRVNIHLPTDGENTCVGAFEDELNARIIVFNHYENEDGDVIDGIYMWISVDEVWETLLEGDMGFNKTNLVTKCNIVNGNLLYWVNGRVERSGDVTGNPPRKINIDKGNDRYKYRKYRIYFDDEFFTTGRVHFITSIVTGPDGVVTETEGVVYETGGFGPFVDKRDECELLASLLNDVCTNVTYEGFDGYLVATFFSSGENTLAMISSYLIPVSPFIIYEGLILVPDNFYSGFIEPYIDRIKYAPLFEPKWTQTTYTNFRENFIRKGYFQFAITYSFDDFEETITSPYSTLAYINPPCGSDVEDTAFNAITIDFTDERLNDPQFLSILRYVNVYVRFGNSGEWRFVRALERHEFGYVKHTMRFLNDGNYPVVATDINRVTESVPLISLGQGFVNNIGYLAGNLEGRDNVKVDVNMNLEYVENPCDEDNYGTLNGKLYIWNNADDVTSNYYNRFQPLYRLTTDPGGSTRFGGVDPSNNFNTFDHQLCFLDGFIIYAAGTNYHTKTKQNLPEGYGIVTIAEAGDQNIYDATTTPNKDAIKAAMQDEEVYSTYELQLPPGRYIIRIASHRLSPDATGRFKFPTTGTEWQGTSTNVRSNTLGVYEAIVEITAGGTTTVDWYLNDLQPIRSDLYDASIQFNQVTGYLIDGETSSDQEVLKSSPRIEGSKIVPNETNPYTPTDITDLANMLFTDGGSWVMLNGGGGTGGLRTGQGATDHNGYFYFIKSSATVTTQIRAITNGVNAVDYGDNMLIGTLDNLDAGTATIATSVGGDNHDEIIIYNQNMVVTTGGRTKVEGVLLDNGLPVPGGKVVISGTNRVGTTDADGRYSILVYADDGGTRYCVTIYTQTQACCTNYPDGTYVAFTISNFATGDEYSDEISYELADFTVDILSNTITEVWKHRNVKRFGLVYKDDPGRTERVNRDDEMMVVIPIQTDPLGGNVGQPVITMEIYHKPPIWAKAYSVVVAVNPLVERWLQMVISDVKYIKSYNFSTGETENTEYAAGDATEVQFSLKPLVDYISTNEGVKLSFIPEEGDRVTFLKDALGEWYGDLYDYEILSYRLSDPDDEASPLNIIVRFSPALPELENGVLVELWSPKKKMTGDEGENEIYYEFGHTYEIINAGTLSCRHSGNENDQIILGGGGGGVFDIPARIRMEGGDCYLRRRVMPIIGETDVDYYDRKVEDPYLNDTDINSNQYSIGRPNYVDKDYKQFFHHTDIRYDQRFNADGNKIYNGHSNFYLLDKATADSVFGAIISLQEVANTAELLAIQHHAIQPVYTEKSPLYDFNNKESIGKSGNPINFGVPLRKNIGSQHANSIVQSGGVIFGFDRMQKTLWQYAGNDLFLLPEEAFLKREMIDLCDSFDLIRVVAVIDRRYGEVVWSFVSEFLEITDVGTGGGVGVGGVGGVGVGGVGGVGGIAGGVGNVGRIGFPEPRTIAYSYAKKGFVGDYSFMPEIMCRLGEQFVSFSAGEMYIHDIGPVGTFYGVKTNPQVKVVMNAAPSMSKDWFAVRLSSLKKWWFPEIEIPPTDNLPNGMKSRLTLNRFEQDEGYWWASLLRDMTDPYTPGTEVEKLFKGRPLKGSVMLLTAECADDEQTTLREIAISVSASAENA